jgi:hypothetical protein
VADPFVTFFFAVVGSKSERVPIIFNASGSASYIGAGSSANVTFETPVGDLSACSMGPAAGQCTPGVPSFSSFLHGTVNPGTMYQISVAISGFVVSDIPGSWNASVDPQVAIDPSFADASDFTLEFSPNPMSAAPEPSSMLLTLFSFLCLGSLVRSCPNGCISIRRTFERSNCC